MSLLDLPAAARAAKWHTIVTGTGLACFVYAFWKSPSVRDSLYMALAFSAFWFLMSACEWYKETRPR